MRVGLFTNNYLPFRGGVTTAVETLRGGLEALGHRVWVFAPAWSGPLPERLVAAAAVRLATRFADSADLVVAPSARIAESLAAGGVEAPIATVPTGVPLDLFCPGDRDEARRTLGLPLGVPLCLYVGR